MTASNVTWEPDHNQDLTGRVERNIDKVFIPMHAVFLQKGDA